MLTEVKRTKHEQFRQSMRMAKEIENILKVQNGNHGAESKIWCEKFIWGVHQQTRSNGRKDQWTQRQATGNNLVRRAKRK